MTTTVEEKLVTLLAEQNERYGSRLSPNEVIRNRLGAEIRSGMDSAFAGCRDYGEKIANRILGLTKDWRDLKFAPDAPLVTKLRADFEPEIDALAKQIANDIRDSDRLKITKKDMRAIQQAAIEDYRSQVAQEVRNLMAAEKQAAKEKAREIFDRLPKMLNNEATFDDIIAEQFTEMLAQDVKLNYQNREDARRAERDYAIWYSQYELNN